MALGGPLIVGNPDPRIRGNGMQTPLGGPFGAKGGLHKIPGVPVGRALGAVGNFGASDAYTHDPLWKYVTVLCPFNGNFADYSNSKLPMNPSGWSFAQDNPFGDGSLSCVMPVVYSMGSVAAMKFAGDFTVEYFIKSPVVSSYIMDTYVTAGTVTTPGMAINFSTASPYVRVYVGNTTNTTNVKSTGQWPTLGIWHHFAVTRKNGVWNATLDGIPLFKTNTACATALTDGVLRFCYTWNNNVLINNFRVTNGVARYVPGSPIDVPLAPFALAA